MSTLKSILTGARARDVLTSTRTQPWGPGGTVTRKRAVGPTMDDRLLWTPLRLLDGEAATSRPFLSNPWVYSAVSAIATNVSRVPLRFYTGEPRGAREHTSGTALERLFTSPNPLTTGRQLIEGTSIWLDLEGEAFWVLSGRADERTLPSEIWCLPPSCFTAMTDSNGMLTGWKYRAGTTERTYPLTDVIQFKHTNPYDPFRGLSRWKAATLGIEQDMAASRFNRAFFENGAVLGGMIESPEDLSDDQYQRLLAQFEDRHRGTVRAHRVGILEGGARFNPATVSQREMDFAMLKQLAREEVFAVFKVNEVVLGIYKDIKSFEGIKSAHRKFWQECLVPRIRHIEEVMWARLFLPEGGVHWGEFDLGVVDALQEDFAEKLGSARTLWQMGWPINQINSRLELGMEEVPWGDLPEKNPGRKREHAPTSEDGMASPGRLGFAAALDETAEAMRSRMRRWLFDQRKRALASVAAEGAFEPDMEQETERFSVLMAPLYEEALTRGAELAGADGSEAAGGALGIVELKCRELPRQITALVSERISAAIATGDASPAESVRGVYNTAAGMLSRAALVEATAALNAGIYSQALRRGARVRWRGTEGEPGPVRPAGEAYRRGMLFPGDPGGSPEAVIDSVGAFLEVI